MNNLTLRSRFTPAAFLGALSLALVSTVASAGDLAAAVTTEVTTAKAEIMLVGVAILGIVGVLLLIRSVRRVAG